MHQHTSPSLTSKLRKLFPTTVTSSSKILTCLVGNREKNSLQLKNAQKPFKINGFPIQQNVHVCMITTNIDTTWLNQGSILLIHRSYHVVGVIGGLYLNISNYNEGSISAACSGPDLFLPEKSRLDA